ncbi:MAG: alpha-ketoacid dehydrogenase subunit beta [Gammaproteobacteria bacterium]|nr:alpha-ketoacid dehydrogenase subunit beta [Gammaproteobacteria bacterium]
MPDRILSYAEAIREATFQAMEDNDQVIVIGEGVPDPKNIFGTTIGLQEKFGPDRVFDMPLSENGVTGICIGAAQAGLRPLMVHQRIDFMLLAMDQLVNHAAKWHFLFGKGAEIPLVIRAIIGRGWGQGPQHAQSLQALFAHIPGLRVVMPSSAYDAKGMLIGAINDNNPVIFLEHRWLHQITGNVPSNYYAESLEGAKVIRKGAMVTIAAFSYMLIEAIRAAEWLATQDIEVEIIDMRVVRPLDMDTVLMSIEKTGRLLVLDTAWKTGGISAEIVAGVTEKAMKHLKCAPVRLTLPDLPAPTASSLTETYYPEAEQVAEAVLRLLDIDDNNVIAGAKALARTGNRDVPNADFTGPF